MKIKAVLLGSMMVAATLFVSCASSDAKQLAERREVQTEVSDFVLGIGGVKKGYAVYTKEKKVRVFVEPVTPPLSDSLAADVRAQVAKQFNFNIDDVYIFELVETPYSDAK